MEPFRPGPFLLSFRALPDILPFFLGAATIRKATLFIAQHDSIITDCFREKCFFYKSHLPQGRAKVGNTDKSLKKKKAGY